MRPKRDDQTSQQSRRYVQFGSASLDSNANFMETPIQNLRTVQMPRLLVVAATVAIFWPALCALPGPKLAHGETRERSLDERLDVAFSAEGEAEFDSVALLRQIGADYRGYLVVERLPRSGAYLTEVHLRWSERNFRLPIQVARGDEGWRLTWVPERSYVEALVELVRNGGPVSAETRSLDSWADAQRMPALPVVLFQNRAVTPFGPITLSDQAKVRVPKRLGKDIRRWVDEILEGDPGPASVDLLAAGETSWRQVTKILFGAATAGLFRLHLIVRHDDSNELRTVSFLAPVFESGRTPNQETSFVAGMYGSSPARFRIAAAGRHLEASDEDCPEAASLCPESPEEFGEHLSTLVETSFDGRRPQISHVMFAATGTVELREALPYLLRLPSALGIPPRKLYLGHIGDEADDRGTR